VNIYLIINYFNILFIFYYQIAAREGHTATCQLLIDNGSEVNVKDDTGYTPLHSGEYLLNN
jgi:hypothetical protein